MLRVLLVLIMLLPACLEMVQAQSNELKFEHLTKEDGLSSSDITSVVQDQQGFIWIGTIDGLNRYDGYTIKTYRSNLDDSTSLCDNKISALYVDSEGVLWVGTENNGLSRYNKDTDSFTNFAPRVYDPKSLSFHFVTSITEDAHHNLWVGTLSGLNRFDRKTQQFKQYFREIELEVSAETILHLKERGLPFSVLEALQKLEQRVFKGQEHFLATLAQLLPEKDIAQYKQIIFSLVNLSTEAESIRSLEADASGNLWIGFEQEGLARFNPASNELSRYRHNAGDTNSLSNDEIMSLQLDGSQLWIGTRAGGLNRLDIQKNRIFRYPYEKEKSHIKCILKDSKNTIWFGDGYALSRYNQLEDSFLRYEYYDTRSSGQAALAVSTLYEDVQGNLWLGVQQGGVNRTIVNHPFVHFAQNSTTSTGLSKSSVSSVLKDSKGNLWVGYFTMGIDFWDAETNEKTHYSYNVQDTNSLGEGTVFKIFEASDGRIWVGTYRGGLQYFDESTRSFITYRHEPANPQSISGNDIRDITEDASGNLWVAVHGGGVSRLNLRTGAFKNYKANYPDWQHSLSNDWVFTVFADSKGRVWAGSVSGVSVLMPEKEHFISYNHQNSTLSHNSVRSIFEDNKGQIWIGTENGLNKFDEQRRDFVVYTERDGLPNNFIMGGMADQEGNLWISTNHGLSRFNEAEQSFRNYSMLDGLQSNEFFPGAYFKGEENQFFFGGKNGLNSFNPSAIRDNAYKTPVVITDFKLFNREVAIGGEQAPLQKHISQTHEIELSYDQNVMSFGFVGLNFVRPEKNQYAYMMEGFEKEWNYVGNRKEATYTNLDPGVYTFKVKAANNDGLWNEQEASLKVTVLPPFWQTSWAYGFYFCFVAIMLYAYRSATVYRERRRSRLRLEKLEAEKIHELDTLKLNFFANISHEFRTPLTLIGDPVDKLVSEGNSLRIDERQGLYQLIQRNSRLLLRLINQLLDISAADAGMMKLRVVQWDIVQFTRSIADAFAYKAEQNSIVYIFAPGTDAAEVYFDPDKLEKILFNLLSNAFKFTPECGKIAINLSVVDDATQLPARLQKEASSIQYVKIAVEDSGVGIPPEEKDKIFERFFQVEKKGYRKKGAGIGLTLVKQLVERHYGEVEVVSEMGKGSTFTIWLPVAAESFGADEFELADVKIPQEFGMESKPGAEEAPEIKEPLQEKVSADSPLLLLVEDSHDVRHYLRDNFKGKYRIEEASNGVEGFEKAVSKMPDLIISDVMMPELSGTALCRKLKSSESTCHIPVILLTAQAAEHNQLEGLETGADDYIAKPFSIPVLKAKVKNLIAVRKLLKQRFSEDPDFKPAEVAVNSLDKKFMERVLQIVEENMANSRFSPDVLASELGMSRSQLYRKMKGLTGLSVSIFIRNIRLREATRLLKDKGLTIAEIAYGTGFSDPAYFSKCFKEVYAKTPTDYIQVK